MDNVNKTLYIPLYGKAFVSRKGIILADPDAERIWAGAAFPLKGKSKSRWLAYYMGMRAAVFDRWVRDQLKDGDAVVLHLGCGLDSRAYRVAAEADWYDVDFPEVIEERKRHYRETERYHMVGADVRDPAWLEKIPGDRTAVVVMEGISMYLTTEELEGVLMDLGRHFTRVLLLMDCYTTLAAKASRYKNPINDVGVTRVHGLDDPKALEESGLFFKMEHDMTPADLIGQLSGMERRIFRKLYAGSFSRKLYRLYEYSKNKE